MNVQTVGRALAIVAGATTLFGLELGLGLQFYLAIPAGILVYLAVRAGFALAFGATPAPK
jgi:hypothetical protein